MQLVPHPRAEELSAYLLGKLSWSEIEQVETHLGACADCRSRVGSLETTADSFVSSLRGVSGERTDDAALERLLQNANTLTQTTMSEVEGGLFQMVAGHEVRRELARGGLGVVYLAYHPLLRDYRVIKRPLTRKGLDRDILLARFRREVQAVGGLRHEHMVRAHDAGADDEGPYLVMEYLDGEPLSRLLTRHGPLPVPLACELVRQAALGLQAGHERGLVHRDVKPSNLMLARTDAEARVVVIDWGLVKRRDEVGPAPAPPEDTAVSTGGALGTADYIAPEQTRDASAVDIRADVYSLGVTFYHLLAGKAPFHGWPELEEKLLAHRCEPFPPLDKVRPDIPPALLAVVAKMVEKDVARRYAIPGEVAKALAPFSRGGTDLRTLLDADTRGRVVVNPPPRGWRRGSAAVAAATLLLLAGLCGWMLLARPTKDQQSGPPPAVHEEVPAAPVSLSGAHLGLCSSLHFTHDGLYAVSECGGGGVFIWNLKNRCLEDPQLHGFQRPDKGQNYSGLVAVSPDGRFIATAPAIPPWAAMNLLHLYDQVTFKPLKQNFALYTGTMGRAIAFSPDGSRLATEDVAGRLFWKPAKVRILDVRTGNDWKTFAHKSPVHCFAFSPDGKGLLLAANEKSVRLRNLAEERQEREFKGHAAAVDLVGFSGNGQLVFSASKADGTLRMWNNGKEAGEVVEKELVKIELGPSPLLCGTFWSGGRALTGHKDGSVVLWELETKKKVELYRHKDAEVTAVAISPDGRHALAALSDHLVYLYRLPPLAHVRP